MVLGSPHVSNSFVSPYGNSCVSQSGWCPALRMSPIDLFPLIATDLSPSLAGGVGLSACLQLICLPFKQLICLPVWLVVSGSLDVSNAYFSLKQFICLPVWLVVSGSPDVSNSFVSPFSNHLSAMVTGGVWRSACFQFMCLPLRQFICLPVWLVVSGPPDASN